jgi:hypothetical protein
MCRCGSGDLVPNVFLHGVMIHRKYWAVYQPKRRSERVAQRLGTGPRRNAAQRCDEINASASWHPLNGVAATDLPLGRAGDVLQSTGVVRQITGPPWSSARRRASRSAAADADRSARPPRSRRGPADQRAGRAATLGSRGAAAAICAGFARRQPAAISGPAGGVRTDSGGTWVNA